MDSHFARLLSGAVSGIDALRIDVEVDVSRTGDPQTVVVGLPDAGVRESRHRVETASPTPASSRSAAASS